MQLRAACAGQRIMGYHLTKSDRDISAALRRIAQEQIDKALASADRRDDLHAGIHDARKKCKKLRGLIRLVRPAFSGYDAENAALRDAARHLAAVRKHGAGLETLDRLRAARPDDVDRDAAEAVRAALVRRAEAGAIDDLDARLAVFRNDLLACRARSAGWTLDSTGFAALAGGLQGTYERALKAMRTARKTRAPEDLHAWRKEAKYHLYHARLLKPIKATKIRPRIAQASALTNLLGDHQDLVDFRALLASGVLTERAGAALLAPAAAEMTRLESAAFDLGRDLFGEKSRAQLRQWHRWWSNW